jgi:hypothetical protein
MAILEQNRFIFSNYGPDPDDGSVTSTEHAQRWRRHVLDDIVPGNELIVSIVRINDRLATAQDRQAAEFLRLHTRDISDKHRGRPISAPARRFPISAENIFAKD